MKEENLAGEWNEERRKDVKPEGMRNANEIIIPKIEAIYLCWPQMSAFFECAARYEPENLLCRKELK